MSAPLDGRLTLATPEGVRLLLTPAGPVPRGWAWLLDFTVWLGAMWFFGLVLLGSPLGEGVFSVLLFVSYWGYPVVCEVYFGGRTLGKRAAGVQVLRSDGLPVGWRESSLRNLLLVADFLPFLYLTGLLFMLFNRDFRRLGDIVAGTQVVYSERVSKIDAKRDAKRAALRTVAMQHVAPRALVHPLTPDQQRALIGLFERESELPPERMLELGTLAEPLTGLTDAPSIDRLRAHVASLTS